MSPRTQKAIDIFLDALNEGTLTKGDCAACAVGTLCRTGMLEKYPSDQLKEVDGKLMVKGKDILLPSYFNNILLLGNQAWRTLFFTADSGQSVNFFGLSDEDLNKVREFILPLTDFTEEELRQIEYTFESTTGLKSQNPQYNSRESQIASLAAVVNLMLSWDEAPEKVEEVFTSKAELIPA